MVGAFLFAIFRRTRQSPSRWQLRELPTGHDAMVTMPRELTDMLLELT